MIGKSRNCAEDELDAIDPETDDATLAFAAADCLTVSGGV